MTDEERRELLGDDVIAHIREMVDAAPEPPPEFADELRRLLFGPGTDEPAPRPADPAAPAADAA
jgi:hypothetical protein